MSLVLGKLACEDLKGVRHEVVKIAACQGNLDKPNVLPLVSYQRCVQGNLEVLSVWDNVAASVRMAVKL